MNLHDTVDELTDLLDSLDLTPLGRDAQAIRAKTEKLKYVVDRDRKLSVSPQAEVELTMEKQFAVVSFNEQMDRANLEQARYFAKEIHRQMHVREALFQSMIRQRI